MKRKQCKNGDHLKPGDTYLEKVPEGVVLCLKCSAKHKDDKQYDSKSGNGWRFGFYKRTVFHK